MILGIDLDNTIINYEKSFVKNAYKNKLVTNKNKNSTKKIIKKIIEKKSKKEWTKLQGEIYGEKINESILYNGFKKFYNSLVLENIEIIIISHKTKYPIIGKKVNLKSAALNFINTKLKKKLILNKNIFFENTIEKKIERIKNCKCDYFIDDLKKIYENKNFPNNVVKILFGSRSNQLKYFINWKDLHNFFIKKIKFNNRHTGKNNKSFIVNEKKIFIKKFTSSDQKNYRFLKELKFMKFLKRKKIIEIPQIIDYSLGKKIIKYEYIKGDILKRREISNVEDIKKVFNFIKKINKLNFKNEKFSLAKDHCTTLNHFNTELDKRISILQKLQNRDLNTVLTQISNIHKKIKLNIKEQNINVSKENLILSPCDLNFNNIIFNKKLFFIDFEYSGLDHLSKLIAVFFLQPDYNIKLKHFLTSINKIIFDKKNLITVKKNIFINLSFCYLRWPLIILNDINKNYKNKNLSMHETTSQNKIAIKKVHFYLNEKKPYFDYAISGLEK